MRERGEPSDRMPNDAPAIDASSLLAGAGHVVAVFAASRILILGIVLLSQMVLTQGQYGPVRGLLPVLTDWDGSWYLGIAKNGYHFRPGIQSNVAFFPIYPLLIRLGAFVFGNAAVVGAIISNGCLLGAGLLLNALMNVEFTDRRVREAAVTFLMFNPMSFFFSDVYSESTFLALVIGSLLAARRGYWLVACLCGMCLSATRNIGVLIAIPLLIELVISTWDPKRGVLSLFRPRMLLLGLVPAGLGLFALFCYWRFGDYLAFQHAGRDWRRELTLPWTTLSAFGGYPVFYRYVFGTAIAAGLLLLATAECLRLRASYFAYAAALFGIYLCGNHLDSLPRYLSVVVPFYIVLGMLVARLRGAYVPLLATSVVFLTLCTVLAANGYWMT